MIADTSATWAFRKIWASEENWLSSPLLEQLVNHFYTGQKSESQDCLGFIPGVPISGYCMEIPRSGRFP
jgi:hypothetical protein